MLEGVHKQVDCQGLSCPMPVVKTKRAIDEIEPGQVLEVIATDPGSVADVKSWATRTGHQFLGTTEHQGTFRHYIRRAKPSEVQEEKRHPHTISHDELLAKLAADPVILDVREPVEYAFGHIPGAKSVPLGRLHEWVRMAKHLTEEEIHVVCHSGNRSDTACQILHEHGFKRALNAVEGMRRWNGPIHTLETLETAEVGE